jgi:hypothetical protein
MEHESDNFLGDNATYILGFTGFFVSGFIELYLDISGNHHEETNQLRASMRTAPHLRSRYYSNNYLVNIGISGLFLVGLLFDFSAFFLWKERKFEAEHATLFIAAYLWLVAAIVVLWTGRSHAIASLKCDISAGDDASWPVRLDTISNIYFLVGTIMDVVTRHGASPDNPNDPETILWETATTGFWMVNALLYLWADALRLSAKKNKSAAASSSSKRRSTSGAATATVDHIYLIESGSSAAASAVGFS